MNEFSICSDRAVDEDVEAERLKVESIISEGRQCEYAMTAHSLTKYYGVSKAVNNISFTVEHRECFGLLGVKGAGKSSIFSILSGEVWIPRGNVYVANYHLRKGLRKYQSNIGYCPQYDALLDNMTGREMLELFSALRGVPLEMREQVIAAMIAFVDLKDHANKLTSKYNGGTKRKLSIALALIGNPSVVLLDEPTAGFDPSTRRKVWASLVRAQKNLEISFVLASHSMLECESLCGRIAILVSGSLRCLGSPQHLKSKWGQGFTMLIKLISNDDQKEIATRVSAMMDSMFPGKSFLKDSHQVRTYSRFET